MSSYLSAGSDSEVAYRGRPALAPIQPFDDTAQNIENEEDADIYRGERPSPAPVPRPLSSSGSTTTSSSSSSDSFLGRRRLGAIAQVVELAISRWARGNSSDSSSSSSSSSTRSSIVTVSRSHIARRRRKRATSSANLRSIQSEMDVKALIKARAESRQIPREFTLYLPPSLVPIPADPSRGAGTAEEDSNPHCPRVARTFSLPIILSQLDRVLKKSSKTKRTHERAQPSKAPARDPSLLVHSHLDYMLPDGIKVPSRPASFTDLAALRKIKKGKQKETSANGNSMAHIPLSHEERVPKARKAWWLDVSSPTWDDMRAIGKLLHLHPLTLEDILQQDPREKLELFPKLGYYFIVFRAVESARTRARFRRYDPTDTDEGPALRADKGVVGETNVYLVVFREGICSFHFGDISEHTDRVRNRVLLLEGVLDMSSDWIAHGILDSVVDSFFPFLEEIEKEVLDIENVVFSDSPDHSASISKQDSLLTLTNSSNSSYDKTQHDKEKPASPIFDEKSCPDTTLRSGRKRICFCFPLPAVPLFLRRHGTLLLCILGPLPSTVDIRASSSAPANSTPLLRMARTRRLVTSLARLLATKSEVVTQVRKRLLTTSQSGLPGGVAKAHDIEVAMYLGDVQDHILTLQHSLAHYERMLSQSHPTYLSQLRTSVAKAKSGSDKAIVYLSVVSIAVLVVQPLIGLFSINVTIPTNGEEPDDKYNIFGIIIAAVACLLCIFLWVVRRWWVNAKRSRGAFL